MTDALLLLIAVLLLVRIVLQIWHCTQSMEKECSVPNEIENLTDICRDDIFKIDDIIKKRSKDNWELVAIIPIDISGVKCYELFFTRKKIKNYYD